MTEAITYSAGPRTAPHWIEDTSWHRVMFEQSMYRWDHSDALSSAMQATRGRIEFTAPRDLVLLERALERRQRFLAQIAVARADRLRSIWPELPAESWTPALTAIDLTPDDLKRLVLTCPTDITYTDNRAISNVLRGIPLTNPLTEAWELHQLAHVHEAACDILEDALCDLVMELAPTHGWSTLALLTDRTTAKALQLRIEYQRDLRGVPGDERRTHHQTYIGDRNTWIHYAERYTPTQSFKRP